MGQIQGIVLPDDIGSSLGGSPEEAAKIFMKTASQGLAQVMANALVQAVGESVGGGAAPDWTKLVKGCAVKLDWETPPNTPVQTAIAFANTDAAPALGGVSVGISISASF
jgi:hypothetical protein